MIDLREPAVAGRFYPGDGAGCTAAVDGYLAASSVAAGPVPKALIAPHAGYVYSGPVAASAYARLANDPRAGRVLILGPAHTVPLRAMAVTTASAWRTPLGEVAVDPELRELCLACDGAVESDEPHALEHSLEVQLPFLQRVLHGFTFLPVVVGAVAPQLVAGLLEAVWELDDLLVVVSTDLSHYHDHATAVRLDRRTAAAIAEADGDAIDPAGACGAYPLRGLLRVVADRGLTIEQLDLRTSGETAGDRDRVVGYGAFAVTEPVS